MDDAKSTPSCQARKWLLMVLLIVEVAIFPTSVTSQNQVSVPAATADLLCISDCATCPVICAPPPPPPPQVESPLPLVEPTPPLPLPLPPPLVEAAPPPPESKPPKSPPQHHSPPPPLPSISWGFSPPPPPGYITIPSGQRPSGMGQRNYTYPYYYFYASKAAASISPNSSSFILVGLMSFIVVILDTKWGIGKAASASKF
ncbi:leucine-rich repeat extensin-like protein 3 [Diospyros lotus]|uniref:leucine-rich repeat extensin-like protein 3 n=1 Tax=Diospyros lotus TaxID=55363 RepID=UPI0022574FD6|nr:leucine-rich repeat extensin-like protein 3 [Diospyros lotus]